MLFDGDDPPDRPWFTSCYDDHVLAGDRDWFLLADSEGRRKRLYDKRRDPRSCTTWPPSTRRSSTRLWKVLEDEAGGTLPQFGVVRGEGR